MTRWRTERLLFVGMPRLGKTTWMKRMLRYVLDRRRAAGLRSRLVVVDPKGEYWPVGATRVQTRKEFLVALRLQKFPIVIHKAIFREWDPLHELRDIVLLVDECHNFCGAAAGDIDDSFRRFVCESGDELVTNSETLLATQRPRHLNLTLRMAATWCFALPLQTLSDRKALIEDLGMVVPDSPAGWEKDAHGFYVPLCYRVGEGMVPPPFGEADDSSGL